ncbi:MAG: spore cortex biosynthesis protein YabQ [Eubacteriales bacterium]
MYENNYLQIYIFLYTLYGGIVIGIVYDFIDVLINGHIIKKRSLTDILFWAIAFGIIIGLLFYVNNITIRSYVFIGFILGWFMYFYILSRVLRKILTILQRIAHLILTKLLKILRVIFSPLLKVLQFRKKITFRMKKLKEKMIVDFKKYKRYFHKEG